MTLKLEGTYSRTSVRCFPTLRSTVRPQQVQLPRVNELLARRMFWRRLTARGRVTLALVASRRYGRFGGLFGPGTTLGVLELAEEKLELLTPVA